MGLGKGGFLKGILMRAALEWRFCFFVIIGLGGWVYAQDELQTRATLAGLEGVYIYVEELRPEIEADGLTRRALEEDAKRELEEGRVPLLSQDQEAAGRPYLYIYLHVFRLPTETRRYIFYIRVELNQQVTLERNPRIRGPAVTWSDGGVGLDFSLENIRDIVKKQVRKFVHAYREANPEKSRPP